MATFRLQNVPEQAVQFLDGSDRVGGPVCYARTVPHGLFNLFDLASAMLDADEQGDDFYALSLTRPALNRHGVVVDMPDAAPTAISIYTVPDAALIEAESGGVRHFRVRPPVGLPSLITAMAYRDFEVLYGEMPQKPQRVIPNIRDHRLVLRLNSQRRYGPTLHDTLEMAYQAGTAAETGA